MCSTTVAPAKEPKNRVKSLGTLIFIQSEIMANIASPAPTLSITLFAKAGQEMTLAFFVIKFVVFNHGI